MTNRPRLVWQDGFVLHTRLPMADRAGAVGLLVAEQPLPILSQAFAQSLTGLSPAEFLPEARAPNLSLCAAAEAGKLQCLPPAIAPSVRDISAQSSPIRRALAGETGVIKIRGDDGEDLVAAFAPLGSLGVGIALQTEAAALREPISQTLRRISPLVVLLIALGTLIVYLQVKPLSRNLVQSRRSASGLKLAFEDRERRLRAIVEHVGDGIIMLDASGRIESANAAALELFGYSKDELIGRNINSLALRSSPGSIETGGLHLLGATGKVLSGRRKDGVFIALEITVRELRANHHQTFIAIVRDISERTRAADAVGAERALLTAALESIETAGWRATPTAN